MTTTWELSSLLSCESTWTEVSKHAALSGQGFLLFSPVFMRFLHAHHVWAVLHLLQTSENKLDWLNNSNPETDVAFMSLNKAYLQFEIVSAKTAASFFHFFWLVAYFCHLNWWRAKETLLVLAFSWFFKKIEYLCMTGQSLFGRKALQSFEKMSKHKDMWCRDARERTAWTANYPKA